ncbi:hypothetical protein PIB30_094244 [Stylosanthes scabra]|uniref:CCHC-type domain-containing protein n=1 Tax=Stylosanthes scabra TaxID=79078 RepID=A0ABU6XXX2_9FABA|nr:hypothetical protein [Stylosanthes scabra]
MKEGSARVSRQEEDLVQRSTKKVKTRDEVDLNQPSQDMEIITTDTDNNSSSPRVSYKDSLLTMPGSNTMGGDDEESIDEDLLMKRLIKKKNLLIHALPFWLLKRNLMIGANHGMLPSLLKGRYARICVEIDLSKQLVPKISVLGSELFLEYEGLHQICFSCEKYGHKADNCTESPMEEAPQQEAATDNGNGPKREKHPPSHSEKILRPGAGKIPQSTKKAPPPKIGPSSVSDKGKKPQHKAQKKQFSPVPVSLNSDLILNRKSKSPEEEAMKGVVMEYMSQFGREQYEAFLVSKKGNSSLNGYVVHHNPLVPSAIPSGISLIPDNNVPGESSSGKPPNIVMEEPRNENSKAGVFARVAVKTKA